MAVAGEHALRDMAGDEEGSWKKTLQKAGVERVPVLKGMADHDAFVDIWVEHLKNAGKPEIRGQRSEVREKTAVTLKAEKPFVLSCPFLAFRHFIMNPVSHLMIYFARPGISSVMPRERSMKARDMRMIPPIRTKMSMLWTPSFFVRGPAKT